MPDVIHPTMPFSTVAFLLEQWFALPAPVRRMWSKHSLTEFNTQFFHKVLIDSRLLNRYLALKLLTCGDTGFSYE